MGNVDGNRNYGYGKQLAWAGKNALADRYGQGHFSTRATHEERWNQFVHFLKVDFPEFTRHLIALESNSMRGVYERQAIHRRVQARSG